MSFISLERGELGEVYYSFLLLISAKAFCNIKDELGTFILIFYF